MQCKVAEFISDHWLGYMDININKPKNKNNKIKTRPITSIIVVDFLKHFNTDKILELQSLSSVLDSFNTAVEHALDQIAPLKEVISTRNNIQPWYDNDIKAQHHIVQRRERLWKKYKLDKLWKAYQCQRNL